MLVHVAADGRSFQLECDGNTSVEWVQQALANLTGIPSAEQILLSGGAKLEAARQLAAYTLPAANKQLYLYNRSQLRSDSPAPHIVDVQEVTIAEVPPVLETGHHPLDDSPSPLLRALPYYERHFAHHLAQVQAIHEASQQRLKLAAQLVAEQRVQAAAIDAAGENVDVHYRSIAQLRDEFLRSYDRSYDAHQRLLSNFERDMDSLRERALHPALQTEARHSLLDCVPEAKLRKWADDCRRSSAQFRLKVNESSSLFTQLQRNVEELFMVGPQVDIRQLEERVKRGAVLLDRQASVVQSLQKDRKMVAQLIEETVSRLSDPNLSTSTRAVDACAALDPMHHAHLTDQLPAVTDCDKQLQQLVAQCFESKAIMTQAVHSQLRSISTLQSRIRDMRNRLSTFKEVGIRQHEAFAELQLVRKVHAAYQACLAEVVRRRAYRQYYAGQASQLAEKIARVRDKEVADREAFVRQHERYIPRDVMAAMGLLGFPSQCEISMPRFDDNLLHIELADIQQHGGAISGFESMHRSRIAQQLPSGSPAIEAEAAEAASEGPMEVARLKMELASAIALLAAASVPSPQGGEASVASSAAREQMEEAFKQKDALALLLQNQLGKQSEQLASYEQRIKDLEQQLATMHAAGQTPSEGKAEVWLWWNLPVLSEQATIVEPQASEVVTDAEGQGQSTVSSEDAAATGESDVQAAGSGFVKTDVQTEPGGSAFPQSTGTSTEFGAESEGSTATDPSAGAYDAESDAMRQQLAERTDEAAQAVAALAVAQQQLEENRADVDKKTALLRECQLNCAQLEKRLHELREEARARSYAANRHAAEYTALRTSSVKLRSLMERLQRCMQDTSSRPGGVAQSLRSFAASMSNSQEDTTDTVGTEWFRASVKQLAEEFAALVEQRSAMLEQVQLVQAAQVQSEHQLQESARQVAILTEAQSSRTKGVTVSFDNFAVQDIAVFLPNEQGFYEAVNTNCPRYYLSEDSVELFVQHQPNARKYIVGQIVHIDRREMHDSMHDNQYELPEGADYAIVTVAMVLPSTA
eukprot:jgi/Chlat1/525/Chrsp103S00995